MKRALAGALRATARASVAIVGLPARAVRAVSTRAMGARGVERDAWLICGLGNPGAKFAGTRHNVGFEVVDALARRAGIELTSTKHRAVLGREMMRAFKIGKSRIVIVYDDLETKLGELRMKTSGSHGGHNGVRSVIDDATRGDRSFARVKIGIGRPKDENTAVYEYVLSRFDEDDAVKVNGAVEDAVEALQEVLLDNKFGDAMTRYNTKYAPKKVKPPKKPKTPKPSQERVNIITTVGADDDVKVTLEVSLPQKKKTPVPAPAERL
jgi:PTH1 family peptidyl-tRNA hydrolase